MKIVALILAGGSGTRLWPLSRQMMPKQLLKLTGNLTLLQESCRRLFNLIPPENQWIITGKEYYFQIVHQIQDLYTLYPNLISEIEIIREPIGKNTAPAVLFAASLCRKRFGEDSVLIVLPSDHLITSDDHYLHILEAGINQAAKGSLVTFGIKPTHPETGYGYIKVGGHTGESKTIGKPYPVGRFVEKPDIVTANKYISEGDYLWNSGMFAFHVGTLLEEAKLACDDIINPILLCNLDNQTEVEEVYARIPSRSIDYAIMEKTNKAYVIPSDFGWSDVGSWRSLFDISPKDDDSNVIIGEHLVLDSHESLIYGKERTIVAIGMQKIAVVDTPDALMVCPLDQTQRVNEAVAKLKEKNNKTYINHKTVERPWGIYTVIEEGLGYKIKKIVVHPKKKLSMQMHYHRSEHWIVVRGTAKVTVGNKEIIIHENESTYIPHTTLHRLENPGHIPLEIIEAQCGNYLEEDDIVRFDDDYGRDN